MSSVVPEINEITEGQFRAAMLLGLARCARTPAGRRALASAMDLSSKGLDNILLKDAMPGSKRLWDATTADPTVLDDIADVYGFALVRKSTDRLDAPGTVPLATLLAQVAAAEAGTSEGGAKKTYGELLAMEKDIRTVEALCKQWIDEITRTRAPRAVKT